MDDSDLDFTDLCAKLLKRVRKKEKGESVDDRRKEASQSLTQNSAPALTQTKDPPKRRKAKHDAESGSRKRPDCQSTSESQPTGERGTGRVCLEQTATKATAISAEASQVPSTRSPVREVNGCLAVGLRLGVSQNGGGRLGVKEKVVSRMQQFRWVSPKKMTHVENNQPTGTALDTDHTTLPPAQPQAAEHPQEPQGDEALALRLQEELDREAQGREEPVDLEQGGLFFCQICQRDLSAMSPLCRTQHINRCLDESEGSGPPPPPAVPDCPICGQRFRSQKSRAAHLKRCSAALGVAPAQLREALQRQAAQTASNCAELQPPQAGGSKRKGSVDPDRPARKRQRKKAPPLDEDTMMALALSRSMLEQEREREMEREALLAAPHTNPAAAAAGIPGLHWRPDAGKRRGKKKGCPPSPLPLLLTQDPNDALRRLQDRVAALLLRTRPPTPPTPAYKPSNLPSWTGAAPLWQKSALQDGGLSSVTEYYSPELSPSIKPWAGSTQEKQAHTPAPAPAPSPAPAPAPAPSPAPAVPAAGAPCKSNKAEPCLAAPSTPGMGSQTLCDLMELAEEGLTLTQWGYAPDSGPVQDTEAAVPELHLSGFVPERTQTSKAKKTNVALSRLAADLSSMVNNPQLSDVQLQVDSGEVFFAHSFMLYAHCPLLVQMVHDSGFGVEEEGMPAARRVLLGDIPPEAVQAVLQYLYTARCPLTPALVPHVQELAARFDLEELEQTCRSGLAAGQWSELLEQDQDDKEEEQCREQNFLELLRSMWEEEEEDEVGGGIDEGGAEVEKGGEDGPCIPAHGESDSLEDAVDEDELLEIYQFAATQRRAGSESEVGEQSREEEEEEERGNTATETEEEWDNRGKRHDKGENVSEIHLSPPSAVSLKESGSGHCRNSSGSQGGPSLDGLSYLPGMSQVTEKAGPATGPVTANGVGEEEVPHQTSQPSPGKGANSSLDRSYDRLFSQSWGDYMEPSQKDMQRSPRAQLQSSHCQGAIIDLSISPPLDPSVSSFPSAGLSPLDGHSPTEEQGTKVSPNPGENSKRESRGCIQIGANARRDNCMQISPISRRDITRESQGCTQISPAQPEPEVIVLSDSEDELDAGLRSAATETEVPSSPPHTEQSPEGRGPPDQSPKGRGPPDQGPKGGSPVDFSPMDRDPTDGSAVDSCVEMSWLIPGTPEPPARSTRAGSTQTYSSMRRTRLFGRPTSSSTSSSSSSLHTAADTSATAKPARLSGGPAPVQPSEPRERQSPGTRPANQEGSCLSAPSPSPEHDPTPGFAVPSPALPSLASPKPRGPILDRPLTSSFPQPTSSTPLPAASDGERHLESTSSNTRSSGGESLRNSALKALRLSLSDSSPLSPRKHTHSTQSRHLLSPEEGRALRPEEERGEERMEGVAEEAEVSLPQQSFHALEDPPMAFDESWGLDGEGGQPLSFSLRLESSAGPSPPETTPPPPAPPQPGDHTSPQPYTSLLESKIWDDWEEEEGGACLPLSQRVRPVAVTQSVAQLKTPVAPHRKDRPPLVPITPLPGYSDMDTPELKNRLNRFGVRPLPRRQMVLKLKEIHQYTHQLHSSESEEDGPASKPPPLPRTTTAGFKQPERPKISPQKGAEHDGDGLSASQGSTASSTAASEESDRSNPELCAGSDSDDSDSGDVTASQAVSREAQKLQAVRSYILSDPELYGRVLRYEPLVLSQLQAQLKARGIRLGATKLLDFLDSQCITFTTAKPGKQAPPRGRGRGRGRRRGGATKTSD
ncbi:hypothetical protein AGOR_G00197040 [Albula goreensis]|uniref:Structure-specific endonuclease subunit SLX4 n=1 Tax=Albula goreensis TaxID=1534307 RepID=A0A8T3CN41_9TELE|nr:hypothetical protein AGOR_G00197040 [Albula goreensis]